MSTEDSGTSLSGLADFNRQLLIKVTALEYVMIAVCHSHPDRDALADQVRDLFEFLEGEEVRSGEAIADLVENLTGFSKQGSDDAP
jgi:hypothetical protein